MILEFRYAETPLEWALFMVLYLYAFWVAYIAVMGIYRAHLDKRLNGFVKWMAYPLVLIGIALDVIAQYAIATVMFADPPRRGEHLVTARLTRYIKQGKGWRCTKARWVCENLLDAFDPTGKHCR